MLLNTFFVFNNLQTIVINGYFQIYIFVEIDFIIIVVLHFIKVTTHFLASFRPRSISNEIVIKISVRVVYIYTKHFKSDIHTNLPREF